MSEAKAQTYRRKAGQASPLRPLIEPLLERHNITNNLFAEEYCGMHKATFSTLMREGARDPKIDTIKHLIRGVQKLEPNFPIEKIYTALELPIPRMHPAMQPAPDLPAPIAAIVASLGDMSDAQLARLEAALSQEHDAPAVPESPVVPQPGPHVVVDTCK